MDEITEAWDVLSLSNREGNDLKLQRKKPTVEFSIMAKFLTKRTLNIDVVARTFKPIWRSRNGFNIKNLGEHKLLFSFDNKSDVDRVLQQEPWSFDKHLVVLQRLCEDTPLENHNCRNQHFGYKFTTFLSTIWTGRQQRKFVQ